ncbi:MAG: signal recognition particle receptor subunit alpha, partial [Sphingomonas sp.]
MTDSSWLDRMRLGFSKTSDRLGDNLSGLFSRAALDENTLDEIEEALVASDLGPTTAAKVRA